MNRNEAIERALNDALAFISKEYRCEKSIAINGEFVSKEAKAVRDSMIEALAMPQADAERDCKDCEGLLEDITELNKALNPEAYGIVDAERVALLERIDDACTKPSEMHSEHEKALYLLADIRAYLQGGA